MSTDSKHVPPTSKIDVASGRAASGAKPDQLPKSEPLNVHGNAPIQPRLTKRQARRNDRFPAQRKDAAARRRKWKRPNAQKSGVFAEALILPGEDPREFEAIHAGYIEEWNPSGLSEDRCVFGMAEAEWRKLRSRRFAQARAIGNSLNPKHPAFDEARGLITFGYLMCREPETAFAEHASTYLRPDKIRHLNQKFPRQNFASIEEWAVAVVEEISSGLQPSTPGFAALDRDRLDPATEALRSEIMKMHSFVTTIHMREFLDDDLEQQERLDARITKLRRDLIEIKANKQLLRRTAIDDNTNNKPRKDRS